MRSFSPRRRSRASNISDLDEVLEEYGVEVLVGGVRFPGTAL
jgi:hypothetical protein